MCYFPILQMSHLRHREGRALAQGHTAVRGKVETESHTLSFRNQEISHTSKASSPLYCDPTHLGDRSAGYPMDAHIPS